MKQHKGLNVLGMISGLFLVSSAIAHPYNSPLTFRAHKSDKDGIVWSNIPKKCFSNGLLTCEELHPIHGKPGKTGNSDTKSQAHATN